MFRKSLVLLCMMFGLSALAEAPEHITVQQVIGMIDNGNHILSENNQETWAIDPNGYPEGFRQFLRDNVDPNANAFRMNHRRQERVINDTVLYSLHGNNVQLPPQRFSLKRIA